MQEIRYKLCTNCDAIYHTFETELLNKLHVCVQTATGWPDYNKWNWSQVTICECFYWQPCCFWKQMQFTVHSTSATISAIKKLVGVKIYGTYHDIRIVKIYLAKMKKENPCARIIDLTDSITAQRHLSSSRARGFASNFQEVLIEGHIPKSAVTLIYRGHKNNIWDRSNWVEYEHLWITLKKASFWSVLYIYGFVL